MRCSKRTYGPILGVAASVAIAVLLAATSAVAGPSRQCKAKLPYDAGVARFEVVDESQPFDPLHGIMASPRILVGVVYYPIERGAGGSTAIDLSYYHDSPEYDSYSRTMEWAFKIPGMSAEEILTYLFGTSIEEHLTTERNGIYADAPIATDRFPVVVQFNGSGSRGHMPDDVAALFARRGYIYIALDAPGVSSLTPIGRVSLDSYPELRTVLETLSPCETADDGSVPGLCFNDGLGEYAEYGVADDGQAVWFPPAGLWETYEVQRARDAVATLDKVKKMFGWRANTRRVGIIGISLGGPPAFVAPQLIDALRGIRGDKYAAYGIVPAPFAVNMIGVEEGYGSDYVFGSQIGTILCDGAPDCDPFEAARQFDFPVGIHIAEEDQLITGFPDPATRNSAEWTFYDWYPGYGPGLTPEPSPENRSPANRILFESISEGVPALRVQVPDSDHINWVSNPFMKLFDDVVLPPYRVFPPHDLYEPLPMDLQQEILVHYSAAFFDLTLKGERGAVGALKTGRYKHVTPDGRGVEVESRSLVPHRRYR